MKNKTKKHPHPIPVPFILSPHPYPPSAPSLYPCLRPAHPSGNAGNSGNSGTHNLIPFHPTRQRNHPPQPHGRNVGYNGTPVRALLHHAGPSAYYAEEDPHYYIIDGTLGEINARLPAEMLSSASRKAPETLPAGTMWPIKSWNTTACPCHYGKSDDTFIAWWGRR